jgi:hypothetical protein
LTVRRRLAALFVPALATALVAGALPASPALAVAPSAAPVPVSPLAGDPPTGTSPVFHWEKTAGAAKYRFQVSTSSTFTTTAYDVTTYALHATPPNPLPAGTLYWHVAGLDASGLAGPYSDTVTFTVGASAGPAQVSPDDGATLTYPTSPPVLVWQPVSGAKSYTVEVDDNPSFSSPATTATVNSQLALTEPPLLQTSQYWRVKAVTGTTTTTEWSGTRSFSVVWPGVPVLTGPTNGASVSALRLSWSPVAGAKSYEVQISTSADFQSGLLSLGSTALSVAGTHYAPLAALQPSAYFWRVRAKDPSTTQQLGGWSATGTFTLSLLAAPTDLAPGLAVDQAGVPPVVTEPRLSWSGVSRASTYELQIGPDLNFSPGSYATCTTLHTGLTPYYAVIPNAATCNLHLAPQRYFWRVRGVNVYNGTWSTTSSFFYDMGAPQVTGPAPGQQVSAPVLSWEPVLGYNEYKVTLSQDTTVKTYRTYATSFVPVAADVSSFSVAAGTYAWTVQAVAANGDPGPMVSSRTYELVLPTTQPTLATLTPDGAADRSMPTMQWNPVANASFYRVFYRGQGASTWLAFMGAGRTVHHAYTYAGEPLAPGTYEWYVEAFNSDMALLDSSAAQPRTFTVIDLDRVTHTGPVNCLAELTCTTHADVPRLTWTPVLYAGSYRVHVATDPQFANELGVWTTQYPSITFFGQLPDNQAGSSYYWFVQPCKSPGVCGPFTQDITTYEQSFRKQTPPVVLTGPEDGVTVGDDPHLSWQDYFPTGPVASPVTGARKYRVQVSTRSDFAGTLTDDVQLDQTSYTPFTKAYPDGTYYWRVQAVDGAGQLLTFSETRSFLKQSARASLDGVVTTTPLPTLTWQALPFVSGYAVEVYTGLDNTTGTPRLTATTKMPAFTPTGALPKGGYTWRVAKLDTSGNRGPWSDPSSFTVTLSTPALETPANEALIGSDDLVFTWSLPNGRASGFRFESSTSPSFATAFETQVLSGTTWASPKRYTDGALYYWRVSALDSAGAVLATSEVRTLTKDSAGPTVVSALPLKDLPLTGTALTVTFSEPVKNVSSTTLVLYPKGVPSLVVAGRVTPAVDGRSATLTPSSPLVPGRTYTLAASAAITDAVGNALVPALLDRRSALTVDSASPAVRELWDVDLASAANGGAYAASRLAGTTMTYTFTGTSVAIQGTRGPLGGYGTVSVDGATPVKVSFYRSAYAYKQVVFAKSGLVAGPHTVTVRVSGGTPPAGSKGTYVYVDAFTVGTAVAQESVARHGFGRVAATAAAGGSFERQHLDPVGDNGGKPEYRMSFDGKSVSLFMVKDAYSGRARVYVDSAYRDVDLYSASTLYNASALTWTGLDPAKTHTLRIVFLGTKHASSRAYAVQLDRVTVA